MRKIRPGSLRIAGFGGLALAGAMWIAPPAFPPAAAALPPASGNATAPLGEPVLEPPTLHSLGAYWVIRGDADADASVRVEIRPSGSGPWKPGPPLVRVERNAHHPPDGKSEIDVPPDGWLFAGSVLLLPPATRHDLRLTLSDPDGGEASRILRARTLSEPAAPRSMRLRHVAPGAGGGTGAEADPFRGLASAAASARPGDLFLVRPGVYSGTFAVEKSGEPGKPIVWRGAGGGESVLDGRGGADRRPGRAVSASGVHDVWFENLAIRNADFGLVAHDSARIVVRRCRFDGVDYGITASRNDRGNVAGFFLTDNTLQGPSTWPRSKGIEDARGIQITGTGHVVAYNRIRGFADAIDTMPSAWCAAIDFHNNDISEMTDDGIEMDYSQRNTRCFYNRLTNVFQGISAQPVYGGPVTIYRNLLYNVGVETFKLHNSPSGVWMLHNTSVKAGVPLLLWTSETVRHCVSRNNLFIGTAGSFAFETTAPMAGCDYDYDGFGGGPWEQFLKWNGVRYPTRRAVADSAPVYRRVVEIGRASPFVAAPAPERVEDRAFADRIDLRLKTGAPAVDAGERLPGWNDDYLGRAPDLGALERGRLLPHFGPRDTTARRFRRPPPPAR